MVHFITSQVFDREINFTMAAHAQRSLDTAVGGLGFTSYLHAVEESARSLHSLQMCVCLGRAGVCVCPRSQDRC